MTPKLTHYLAMTLAAVTLLMVTAGGLVTTMDAGDSVPDWPLSYGSVLPDLTGGILYEHSHRMIGWLVGFLSMGLAILLWRTEPRPWVRRFGLIALLAIFAQGALGGIRVLIVSNPDFQGMLAGSDGILNIPFWRKGIAMIHAVSGQLIFCLMALLAWVTSTRWTRGFSITPSPSGPPRLAMRAPSEARGRENPGTQTAQKVRRLALMTTGWIFLQIILGIILRHTGGALSFHIGVAILVLIHAAALAARTLNAGIIPGRLGLSLGLLVLLQILMGVGAWASLQSAGPLNPGWAIFLRTGHVALGALVLACSLVLALELSAGTPLKRSHA